MNLSIGIVGLPNVGKSTLFNALLQKQVAFAANYPFATIEPNVGVVEVPDERLPVLAKIVNTEKIVPAIIEFYDIAGLVKGASQGEGLGNKFLSHIKEVAAIVHVVRLFEDKNVAHITSEIDPVSDLQTVETELILADLATLDRQPEPKMNATKDQLAAFEVIKILKTKLNEGLPARKVQLDDEREALVQHLNLLTFKPVLYVFNLSEDQLADVEGSKAKIEQVLALTDSGVASLPRMTTGASTTGYIYLCAKLENEIVSFSPAEQKEYLNQYGLPETGLNRLIKKAYEILGLISFLTAGEKEVRAWTIPQGTLAPQAAATIHTDFEKHFIKADIVQYKDFVEANGWVKARELGKVISAGKDHLMKDGDVVEFKVGV
jgi:GTP-binding protein YchF